MQKPKKKINNGLIVMSKGERIGVISLLSVITVLLAISVFRPAIHFTRQDEWAFHNLDSMIALQERQARQGTTSSQPKTKQPSHSAGKPLKDSYENTPGKPVTNRPASNKSVTNPVTNKPATSKAVSYESKAIPILDINRADSVALVDLPQIGQVMASRIHRYRNRLGGFISMDQLFEVKGMDSTRYATIKPYIILENNEIHQLDVNRDAFKTLLRHPYLEYEQVKAIVNYRERKGLIKSWEQLKGIVGEVNPFPEGYVVY